MFLKTLEQRMNLFEDKASHNQFNKEQYIFCQLFLILIQCWWMHFLYAEGGCTIIMCIESSLEFSHSNEVDIECGVSFSVNYHDLSLCFNASTSQLDPTV